MPPDVLAIRLDCDGTGSIVLADGRTIESSIGRAAFGPTSAIATSTVIPRLSLLVLTTTRDDRILVDLPRPADLAPLRGRPTVYLDQNHWSTLTNAIHQPERVANKDELAAACTLIDLARRREVVLPMSSAHMAETCKQIDSEERSRRALTIAQLAAGWQLRHPLAVRRTELLEVFSSRYGGQQVERPVVVTLEPDAAHDGQKPTFEDAMDLPDDARWIVKILASIGGSLDAMLDAEHVPMLPVPDWAAQFQEFATFLADSPTELELKRRRTHAKFITDLGRELPEAAYRAKITPDEMDDWVLHHSESDLRDMPALGLFREVIHEKLCNTQLRWEQNDLVDMMYLTVAAGYCDHVVGERSHISRMNNGLRRLGRGLTVMRNLRSLLDKLPAKASEPCETPPPHESSGRQWVRYAIPYGLT